jgi:hypothetical protein
MEVEPISEENCPWNRGPVTLEEMLKSCDAQARWEALYQRQAPYAWCIILKTDFAAEICRRIIRIEAGKN